MKRLREERRLTLERVAELAGTTRQQIHKLETGERRMTVEWMVKLGKAFGVEPKELLPPEAPATGGKVPTLAEISRGPVSFGEPDLPIHGRAQGGRGVPLIPEGAMPVDYIHRPPQLRNVKDAFAVYVYDDSMSERYEHGETLWVNPHLPTPSGCFVVVVLNNDEAIVKKLLSRSDDVLRLRQLNPKKDFTLKMSDVRHVYRIVGSIDTR